MVTSLHYSCLSVIFFIFTSCGSAEDFIFSGFRDSANNISLEGSARITSNALLQLTNETGTMVGHAFFNSPIRMLANSSSAAPTAISFSTEFVFDIVKIGSRGGHGLAFMLAPKKSLPDGSCCQYLGLFSEANDGKSSNHLFAIEFDTTGGYNFASEIDNNHVGVDINSVDSVKVESAGYYVNGSKKEVIALESSQPIRAWIEYDSASKLLNVTIALLASPKPQRPLISYSIDLSPMFREFMYAGFSSSTGKLASNHYILGWSFRTNGVAQSLNPSQLPFPHLPTAPSTSIGNGIRIGAISSFGTFVLVAFLVLAFLYLKHRAKLYENIEDWELDYPHRFPYRTLYRSTKGFKETGILGRGGFGIVYKGILPKTKEEVAIKKISNNSKQGVREFIAEVASLGRLRHRNLVYLQGWCKRNNDLLLVYDYMPNGSLDMYLFDSSQDKVLCWEQRFKILNDIARGLLYLHEEWEKVVVHRDIKPSNVLLDAEMTAKLSDFGLATLYEHGENPQTTHVVGTVGYIAPELSRTGKATASSDVFAYGILMLEVASGRRAIEPTASPEQCLLLDYVRECWMNDQILNVVDPKLGEFYVKEEMDLVLKLGLACSQSVPDVRPTMRQLLRFLDGYDSLGDDVSFVFSEMDPFHFATPLTYSSSFGVMSSSSLIRGGR